MGSLISSKDHLQWTVSIQRCHGEIWFETIIPLQQETLKVQQVEWRVWYHPGQHRRGCLEKMEGPRILPCCLCTHQNPIFWNTGGGNTTLAVLRQGGASDFAHCVSPTGQVCTLLAERLGRKLFTSHFQKKKPNKMVSPDCYEVGAKGIWLPALRFLGLSDVAHKGRLCLWG